VPDVSQYSAGGGLLLSYEFWVAFSALILLSGALNRCPAPVRHGVFVVLNALFLFAFTGIGLSHLLGLFAGLSILYLVARRIARNPGNGRAAFLLALGGSLLLWAAGKIAVSVTDKRNPLSWLFFVGVSFLVVKVWTFLKDVQDGRVTHPSFVGFLNYCTYFPCFTSGPMHYYGEFAEAMERPSPVGLAEVVHQIYRILWGTLKVRVLAVSLGPYSLTVLHDASVHDTSLPQILGRALVYSVVLYLDFSGSCDIAIGVSRLLGIPVPENFRLPYLATNIRDFWQAWHITFTRFLTQYIFVPLVRACQASRAIRAGRLLAVYAYLVTFAFVGFWHGSALNFLVWGVWHGLGLALYDLYRQTSARAASPGRRARGPWELARRTVAVGLTFSFVSVGWIFFVLPMRFFL